MMLMYKGRNSGTEVQCFSLSSNLKYHWAISELSELAGLGEIILREEITPPVMFYQDTKMGCYE